MSLKIVGVQPLLGCADGIKKKLSADTYYPLDNNFSFNPKTEEISKEKIQKIPDDFFFTDKKKSSLKNINVQAIVGKNGKGKSSIVELIIRILNNFFKEYKIGKVTDNLFFAKGVYANLFVEINGKIGKIFVDSRKIYHVGGIDNIIVKFSLEKKVIFDSTKQAEIKRYRKEIINIDDLFFTMYINYSLYGLDDEDYHSESEYYKTADGDKVSWLTQLFHKNDGYQTPIVLHPFREAGQIYIRNEKYLVSQRLISTILDRYKNDFYLTDDLLIDKIKLTFKEKDALADYLDRIITSDALEINNYKEVEEILRSHLTKDSNYTAKIVNDYYDFLVQNKILLDRFKETINNKKTRNFILKNESTYSDLTFINLANFARLLNISVSNESDYVLIYQELMQRIEDAELKARINYIITETADFNFYIYNIFQILTIYFNFWKQHFKLQENNIIFTYKKYHLEKHLFYYCMIKSYKSIAYPKYDVFNRSGTILSFAAKLGLDEKITTNPHTEFLNKIVETDNSHISLKLRQSQKILKLCLSNQNDKLVKLYKKFTEKTDFVNINNLNTAINNVIANLNNESRLFYLPPKIFETNIFLKSAATQVSNIDISTLSSGEYQKNSIISSLIYHLKNIDSVEYEEGKKMESISSISIAPTYKFRNINVILDEIELYFHPEYQRVFIADLLKQLSKIRFRNIEGINFLFVTHSPFILSDIPQQNILFLNDDAKPEFFSDTYNTFGGNIHDLLAHNFFLKNGAVGEFALDKIDEIIKLLNNKKLKERSEEERDHLLKNINLIGESFLRNKLLDMFYAKLNKQKRIDELEAELLKLKQND
ncbi:hypothetical protein NZ698_14835 [Chryseobacterium sp. PBS4-4]|uniref:ATPase AAA-type core domain-containing protein n=1 Tax=Chryseobacterium edaphi TaxID=2976532 RepID=A0ABT2W8F3_9FLAO|nr:hypothetical protein [Chryseobacterium edaphi]MCU7618474.1 hypothetical protein [Chryseobacterium edaphi]